MSEIRRYVLVGADDVEDDYEYESYQEAYEAASRRNMAVVARVYAFDDSELVWTPNGEDTWPPESGDLNLVITRDYRDEPKQ